MESNTVVQIAISDKAMTTWTQVPAAVKKPKTLDQLEHTISYCNALVDKFKERYKGIDLDVEAPGTWVRITDLLFETEQKVIEKFERAKIKAEILESNIENKIVERGEVHWERYKPKMVDGERISAPYICVENYVALLNNLNVRIRYNEMTKEEEFITGEEVHFTDDTRDNAIVAWIANEGVHVDFNMSPEKHKSFITLVANEDSYHPIRDWIESKPWDGKSRMDEFVDTVILNSAHELKDVILTTWGISAVAALYLKDGIKSQGFVAFTGSQGIGKSSWTARLVPTELKDSIGDGLSLNPDKPDSVAQVVSHWIVELAEVGSTFRKADIDSLKAFITRDRDVFRPPYAARANKYKRRTVFMGTVNDLEFLQDSTGNRRYWTLDVKSLDFKHNIDVQQLWAEFKMLYDEGVPWWLNPKEMKIVDRYNKSFMTLDPIIQNLEFADIIPIVGGKVEWFNVTTILKRCGVTNPNKKDLNTAGNWLRSQGLESDRKKRWGVTLPCDEAVVGWLQNRLGSDS